MQNLHRFLSLLFAVSAAALLLAATSAQERPAGDKPALAGKLIQVGPSRDIRSLGRAAQIARDGDIIEVDPGEYHGDSAVWTQNDLVIRGVGERPRLVADGVNAAEGKGIFVVRGGSISLENLSFSNARVPERNGAGIRLDRGRLKVIGCAFDDNENGILTSNDPASELHVVRSTFVNNGAGDGHTHHLYAGTISNVHVTGSYFGPARVGHLLKSRAKETSVYYSRLTGEGGTSSYEIDIPNGGRFKAIGNLVQQGDQTENPVLISYGAEGYRWPDNHAHIAFNTLVNDRTAGGVFVAIRSGAVDAAITNNVLVGRADIDSKVQAVIKGNVPARASDFASPAKFDYRLRPGSKFVGAAGPAGLFGKEERPASDYSHVANVEALGEITNSTLLSPGAFQRPAR